jgi:hypothetical protein
VWLVRETRSRTAALVALALAAQSPLALETMWWYSAASFSYAVVAIQAALLGASLLATRPRSALIMIVAGTVLAPAGTTIGLMATPLAALRIVGRSRGFVAAEGRRRAGRGRRLSDLPAGRRARGNEPAALGTRGQPLHG